MGVLLTRAPLCLSLQCSAILRFPTSSSPQGSKATETALTPSVQAVGTAGTSQQQQRAFKRPERRGSACITSALNCKTLSGCSKRRRWKVELQSQEDSERCRSTVESAHSFPERQQHVSSHRAYQVPRDTEQPLPEKGATLVGRETYPRCP